MEHENASFNVEQLHFHPFRLAMLPTHTGFYKCKQTNKQVHTHSLTNRQHNLRHQALTSLERIIVINGQKYSELHNLFNYPFVFTTIQVSPPPRQCFASYCLNFYINKFTCECVHRSLNDTFIRS